MLANAIGQLQGGVQLSITLTSGRPQFKLFVEDVLRLERFLLAQQENFRPKYFGPILPHGFHN
jgi:hypothetical protein